VTLVSVREAPVSNKGFYQSSVLDKSRFDCTLIGDHPQPHE